MNFNTTYRKELPTEGNFIVVWSFNNYYWSDTFVWEDGYLKVYVTGDVNDFVAVEFNHFFDVHPALIGDTETSTLIKVIINDNF